MKKLAATVMQALFSLFMIIYASSGLAQAGASLIDRQAIVLRGGLGEIIGVYYFAVNVDQSKDAKPERLRVKLLLPKEVADFAAAEGIKPEDVRLGEDGGIYVEKDFNPGFNSVGVFFSVKGKGRNGLMTFTPATGLSQLRIFSETENLQFTSEQFDQVPSSDLEGGRLVSGIVNKQPLESGKAFVVGFDGLAEGRQWFWLLGSITGALLIGLVVFMFMRTREKVDAFGIGS